MNKTCSSEPPPPDPLSPIGRQISLVRSYERLQESDGQIELVEETEEGGQVQKSNEAQRPNRSGAIAQRCLRHLISERHDQGDPNHAEQR